MIKKNKGSRSWSRILAVQALYQLYLNRDANRNTVIKKLLQTYLPLKTREKIVNKIFTLILNNNEKTFSKKIRTSCC